MKRNEILVQLTMWMSPENKLGGGTLTEKAGFHLYETSKNVAKSKQKLECGFHGLGDVGR